MSHTIITMCLYINSQQLKRNLPTDAVRVIQKSVQQCNFASMLCTVSNKHTQNEITRIKQKYSNDNQKARRKIIELQPQNFIYSFQVKLNKTTYLSFKHIMCRFMIESDNVTDNLVFAVNSLITLY